MKTRNIFHNKFKFLYLKPLAFIKDSKAVAAVEFAMIAPILLLLFIGTIEVSFLISIDRKISRTSSVIADLATQQRDFDQADLNNFMGAAQRIMFPYSDRIPCVVITRIYIEADDLNNNGLPDINEPLIAEVVESVDNRNGNGAYISPQENQCRRSSDNLADGQLARQSRNVGDEVPVPESIKLHDTTLVMAEVEYDHFPIIGFIDSASLTQVKFDEASISVGDRIYLRPRVQ